MHLIMFDIDGTLVDSSGFEDPCFLRAAREVLGADISSDWEGYAQVTDTGILAEALERLNVPGDRAAIRARILEVFTDLVADHLANNPDDASEIRGASSFIRRLKDLANVRVAIATGGWAETAKLKLRAAGIDFNGCGFASSADARSRTEIMRIAESRIPGNPVFESRTYFGDAPWDKEACRLAGYRFVLIGNRLENELQFKDYRDQDGILTGLGLEAS